MSEENLVGGVGQENLTPVVVGEGERPSSCDGIATAGVTEPDGAPPAAPKSTEVDCGDEDPITDDDQRVNDRTVRRERAPKRSPPTARDVKRPVAPKASKRPVAPDENISDEGRRLRPSTRQETKESPLKEEAARETDEEDEVAGKFFLCYLVVGVTGVTQGATHVFRA